MKVCFSREVDVDVTYEQYSALVHLSHLMNLGAIGPDDFSERAKAVAPGLKSYAVNNLHIVENGKALK